MPAVLAIGAGLCLLSMVGVVCAGVVMRYLVGNPILGVNEIVQMAAVALAMLALPYATSSGAHVRVDLLDGRLGRWGRLTGDLFSRALSIVALIILCRQAWSKAVDALEYGDVTNMLQLPIWVAYAAILLGMGLCAVVFAVQMVALVAGRDAKNE